MASVEGLNLGKLTPEQLELTGRIAFSDPVKSFTPYLMLQWLDVFCLGLSIVLAAHWVNTCWKSERRWSRYLVYWVMSMSVASSVVIQVYILSWFATGFGRYAQFFNVVWIKVIVLLGSAVRIPAMSFYLHRAFVLSGRQYWVVLLVAPLILYYAAVPIAQIWVLKALPYSPIMKRLLSSSSACAVAADVVITAVIAYQLYRNRTGWSATDRMITRLLYTLAETQTPPLIMAMLNLILFYTIPNTTAQMLLVFSPKISCICVIATLISRVSIAEETRKSASNVHSRSLDGSMQTRVGGVESHYQQMGH